MERPLRVGLNSRVINCSANILGVRKSIRCVSDPVETHSLGLRVS